MMDVVVLKWRGTSLPSEKSWSAGSMVTGSWRRNSKSGSGSHEKKGSGDVPMLLMQAEAIGGSCTVCMSLFKEKDRNKYIDIVIWRGSD